MIALLYKPAGDRSRRTKEPEGIIARSGNTYGLELLGGSHVATHDVGRGIIDAKSFDTHTKDSLGPLRRPLAVNVGCRASGSIGERLTPKLLRSYICESGCTRYRDKKSIGDNPFHYDGSGQDADKNRQKHIQSPQSRLIEIILENLAIYNQATALGLLLVIVPLLTFFAATKV